MSLDARPALNEDVMMGDGGEEDNKEESQYQTCTHQLKDIERHDRYWPIVWYFNYASLHMERNGYLSYTGADTPSVDALDDQVGSWYAIAFFL